MTANSATTVELPEIKRGLSAVRAAFAAGS
jgi:hypothetical protein